MAVLHGEEPVTTSTCELRENPAALHGKLVEVTSLIVHGFEVFQLFDPSCKKGTDVWLEYGGTLNSATVYCCGNWSERRRKTPLEAGGMSIPLVEDAILSRLDKLLQKKTDKVVRATLRGRFFKREQTVGYGHFGCCSLLAIQQILSVEPHDRAGFDYRLNVDFPKRAQPNCSAEDLKIPSRETWFAEQQKAELEARTWAFQDPRRVAAEFLARSIGRSSNEINRIEEVQRTEGRVRFRWKQGPKIYDLTLSRPYWLSTLARDPQRVLWVVLAAREISCQSQAKIVAVVN